MPSQTIFIESEKDKTRIEIKVSSSISRDEQPNAAGIVIAHPYGPLGGNMNNNVVNTLQRYFQSKGYVTLCINFRGCGRSEGNTSWTGMPEREDYMAAINFLLDSNSTYSSLNFPVINQLVLSGYSFGSMIASSIQCDKVPTRYLLISFPLGVIWALATVKASFFKTKPTTENILCICGDKDQFTNSNKVKDWYPNTIVLQGVDHFWFDQEFKLTELIEPWIQ